MTSKNLYFNLIREDLKRRVWTIALSTLAFLIGLPIYAMLSIEKMMYLIETEGIEQARIGFASIASTHSVSWLFVITVFGAILCGLSGFYYLYSRSKVDLYHSIPVKREKLFIITFINGIVIYVIPYIVNLLLYFIIGGAKGLLTKSAVSGALFGFVINLVGYLLIYTITIIAVMMTGKLIVGFFGTIVFLFYGPALLAIKSAISTLFFQTFYEPFFVKDRYSYSSPVFAYNQLYSTSGESGFIKWLLGILVMIAIFTALCLWLYKMRPSEAAGGAMAFKKTQAVIKFLITIPTAIVGGLLFYSISYTNAFAWMLFGIVFIGFLAHGIIEIIYNSDFKYIIRNKIQLAGCIIIAIILVGAAKMDWFQYDKYIPNQNKVESMSVAFDNLEPMDNYYDLKSEYYSMDDGYYNYVPTAAYRLDHMNLTNFEPAYQMAAYAVDHNYSQSVYEEENSSNVYTTLTVKYNLKNNTVKYRKYIVKINDILGYVDKISTDESYKEGVYQILTMDRSLISKIRYFNNTQDVENTLQLSEVQKQEFLDIYTQELKSLTATQILSTLPIAQIDIVIGNDYNDFTQPYYVYPEFTRTIEYMKAMGADLETSFNTENVKEIVITNYKDQLSSSYNTEQMKDIPVDKYSDINNHGTAPQYKATDKEEITAICKALVPTRLTYSVNDSVNIAQYLEINISYENPATISSAFSIQLDKLPLEIQKKIGY